MRLKINEAIDLRNALQKEACEKSGKKFEKLTKANLGRIIFGGKGKYPLIRMSSLCNGTKMVRQEWVEIICKETGIDANFLFDQNSEFNILYSKLLLIRKLEPKKESNESK